MGFKMAKSKQINITNLLNRLVQLSPFKDMNNHLNFLSAIGKVQDEERDSKRKEADSIITELYERNKDINSKVSYGYFRNDILDKTKQAFSEKQVYSSDDAEEFMQFYKDLPLTKYLICKDILGVKIENDEPIIIGQFTIYDYKKHKDLIHSEGSFKVPIPKDETEYLACISITAGEPEKAIQDADLLFEEFELMLKFFLQRARFHDVGIFNYNHNTPERTYVFNNKEPVYVAYSGRGATNPIVLYQEDFDSEIMVNKLWGMIGNSKISKIQKRLLFAIKWIGQTHMENDHASSFIKFTIALEILLKNDEKGVVTPSIMAQISEACAILLGSDYEERSLIEKDVKYLYSIRSGIVHKGKNDINHNDLLLLYDLLMGLIVRLLNLSLFLGINSLDDLHTHLKKCKYSFDRNEALKK